MVTCSDCERHVVAVYEDFEDAWSVAKAHHEALGHRVQVQLPRRAS